MRIVDRLARACVAWVRVRGARTCLQQCSTAAKQNHQAHAEEQQVVPPRRQTISERQRDGEEMKALHYEYGARERRTEDDHHSLQQ